MNESISINPSTRGCPITHGDGVKDLDYFLVSTNICYEKKRFLWQN